MNSNNFLQTLQQGYHIAIGATAALLETLQDTQKREAMLSNLAEEWNQRSQEWSEKGEVTEREARQNVETWINQRRGQSSSTASTSEDSVTVVNSPSNNRDMKAEIRDLTEKITALRTELEHSQQPD